MQQSKTNENKEKIPPDIKEAEDVPFDNIETSEHYGNKKIDNSLAKDTDAKETLDFKRFSLGSSTLGWSLFAMFVCMIISIWAPKESLVQNGFEAFKLIATTILGYIFGSNNKSQ